MPRSRLVVPVLLSCVLFVGCEASHVGPGPSELDALAGSWELLGFRFSDGPFIDAGSDTREASLTIDSVGRFTLTETVDGVVSRKHGILTLKGEELTLLVTNEEGTGVDEVLTFLWAGDRDRLTLTMAVDTRWELFAYERVAS